MLTAIAFAEAIAATGAFAVLSGRYVKTSKRLRHVEWEAQTLKNLWGRKQRRMAGAPQGRDERGRFA